MRPLLILSTLCAVGLFGGAALAEHPDHATKEKPTREHTVREHASHDAKTPERIERLRSHGEVEHAGHAAGVSELNRTASDKARAQIQKQLDAKADAARNCSGVGDECASHRQLSSSSRSSRDNAQSRTVGLSGPYSGWYAQQRDKMREEAMKARLMAAAMKKMKAEGK
jgi:hypothetical protein